MLDPVKVWQHIPEFKTAEAFVKSLKVVNDIAERGEKIMSDFTNVFTIDKMQREHLLQAVEHHRQKFENFRKSCLNE